MKKTEINVMYCDQSVKNTGLVDCAYSPANIGAELLLRRGTVITPTLALAIITTIKGWLAEDNASDRAHIIGNFEGMESKNTEGVYNESQYGIKRKTRDGKYGRRFEYRDGGLAMHTKLKTFDGKQSRYDLLEVDFVNNGFWGTKVSTGMKGFKLDMIDVPNFELNNGSDPTKFYWEVAFADSDEFNKRPAFLKLPDEISVAEEFVSLIDTEINIYTAMDNTGLVSLQFTAGNGAVNLGTDYSAIIADQSLFTVSVLDTGADLDIDSVAWNAGTGAVDIQLDATDPDFPASGANILISLGPVSAIDAAGMPGYSEASVITPLG
jgi:hypothetical protein